VRHGEKIIVIFTDSAPAAGARGSAAGVPALEVELSNDGAEILGSHFVR
jgi:hypothetical protein